MHFVLSMKESLSPTNLLFLYLQAIHIFLDDYAVDLNEHLSSKTNSYRKAGFFIDRTELPSTRVPTAEDIHPIEGCARAVFWELANRKAAIEKSPQAGDCCSREAGESGDLISFPDLRIPGKLFSPVSDRCRWRCQKSHR